MSGYMQCIHVRVYMQYMCTLHAVQCTHKGFHSRNVNFPILPEKNLTLTYDLEVTVVITDATPQCFPALYYQVIADKAVFQQAIAFFLL